MTKKWIAINLLLLVTAALLGWKLRESILQFNADNNIAKIQPVQDIKQKIAAVPSGPKAVPANSYNPEEFAVIADKNVFSDTRSRDESSEVTAPPEQPPLAQKPILVGVVITETQRTASIIDPASAPTPNGRNRSAQIKKIGDVYQGYTITDISPERIVLESGARREIIPLREGTKRTPTGKTPILSTRIVPIGGGTISGGTPVAVGGSVVSAAAPPRTVVAPIASAPAAPGRPAATQAPGRAVPSAVSTPSAQPAPPSAPSNIIRTPFGNIVRRAQ
jgi:hypothetical protein